MLQLFIEPILKDLFIARVYLVVAGLFGYRWAIAIKYTDYFAN